MRVTALTPRIPLLQRRADAPLCNRCPVLGLNFLCADWAPCHQATCWSDGTAAHDYSGQSPRDGGKGGRSQRRPAESAESRCVGDTKQVLPRRRSRGTRPLVRARKGQVRPSGAYQRGYRRKASQRLFSASQLTGAIARHRVIIQLEPRDIFLPLPRLQRPQGHAAHPNIVVLSRTVARPQLLSCRSICQASSVGVTAAELNGGPKPRSLLPTAVCSSGPFSRGACRGPRRHHAEVAPLCQVLPVMKPVSACFAFE